MNFKDYFLTNKKITQEYLNASKNFAETFDKPEFSDSEEYVERLSKWSLWEEKYLSRGFRSIPLNIFVESIKGKSNLESFIGAKRLSKEKAISYSKIVKEDFLGLISPILNHVK